MTDATLADLSEDGQQLLDNAINWADVTAAARLSSKPSAPVTKEYVKGSWKLHTYLARKGAYMTPSAMNPGAEQLTVAAGQIVQIPAGVPHSLQTTTALVAVQLYSPRGPEQRFKK